MATPETDRELLSIVRHATAGQLETIVRAYRGVLTLELGERDPAHRRRFVRCDHDDDGSLLLSARLPAEEGALVLAALQTGRDAVRAAGGGASAETTHIGDSRAERTPGEGEAVSNADALLLMADSFLSGAVAERTGAERYEVVVHVDAPALAGSPEGACSLDEGSSLHPETARRLACDASVVRILERDGRPLSVGRRSRSVPPALRRALRSRDRRCRDRRCRFPGCGQRRFLHAHHLQHRARGGRTDLSNLIHLCGFHHHLVHEGGYTIEGHARGELRFRRPDGLEVECRPLRPLGEQRALERRHRGAGLVVTHRTCVPHVGYDRLQPAWVVDGLVEHDPRLRE